MKNISFDNPYLLLVAIPIALAVIIPFLIVRNKDNKSAGWTVSLWLHLGIIALAVLAAAGFSATSVLTKTTVYVLADVSYSSERNLDEIDAYVEQIRESLPENASLGVVCFGRDSVLLTSAGRTLRSVSEAKVDDSATDIVSALNYTETLFGEDTINRIVLITDGNDTVNQSVGSVASTVERLTENGIKIDAIFLDNTLKEGEVEVQLLEAEYAGSTYLGHANEAKFLIQSSEQTQVMLTLYARPFAEKGEPEASFEQLDYTVVNTEGGLTAVKMPLPADVADKFEYKVEIFAENDLSPHNNTRSFTQTVVGRERILLITGREEDRDLVESLYGESAEIDAYTITPSHNTVPFVLDEIIAYDEIVISNVDIREIKHVNALIDSLDMAISQYGKSLITLGDLRLQTNADDATFRKFSELLPIRYGNTGRDGRLYTVVLDISHSMFMASKLTIAKDAAIKLISVMDDEDYLYLVPFFGTVDHSETPTPSPKKVKDCKQEVVNYIVEVTSKHGTDMSVGLETALSAIKELDLSENHIMLISDGLSFESEKSSVEIARQIYDEGATISAVNTYIPSDGTNGKMQLQAVVNAGAGGKYYEISKPERVSDVVFGTMANDVGNVIIEKDASVNVQYKDPISQGFSSFPKLSGFILSTEKYGAKIPLTVTYQKDNGRSETVPLYAHRAHGNGKVACFTGSLTGSWAGDWDEAQKARFLRNLFSSNTPPERMEVPFSVKLERTDHDAYVEIVPGILDPDAKAKLKITDPIGRISTKELAFDSSKYFYTLGIGKVGRYTVDVTYSAGEKTYATTLSFEIAYEPEYNAFAAFDRFTLYRIMRNNGQTAIDGIPDLTNDKNELTTYKQSYVIPLLAAAIALFVLDVLIRKLRRGKKSKTAKKQPNERRSVA
ncbi:MAG: VWA domain-containing protein [Clostridia bacterium]|nr:VWA domain-containing protein [Clostridia bacterium]